MSSEDKYLIDTSPQRPNAEDYLFLRAAAIDQITQLGSNLWTDYNIHDPGITILELLCYALTDLGYRTSFPVADLLTRDGDGAPAKDSAFYTAKEILTSHPVTVEDYRKYIIDAVPGVRNIWFDLLDDQDYSPAVYIDEKKSQLSFKSPYFGAAKLRLRGLYNARIELEETELLNTRNFKPFLASIVKGLPNGANGNYSVTQINDAYRMHVRKKLLEKRNLCEDFHDVVVVAGETVALCADIELTPQARPEEVYASVIRAVYHYISPPVPDYTIEELLEKGKTADQVFEGPAAIRGFIDLDELAQYNHREVIYVSDVINLLMDIDGVRAIREIHFDSYRLDAKTGDYTLLKVGEKYSLKLTDPANASFRFMLDYNLVPKKKLNKITFHKGAIYFPAHFVTPPPLSSLVPIPGKITGFTDDLPYPDGTNRSVSDYYSVQDDFPKAYMTGREGVPDSATPRRKAQRLQLKGFLLFFDQLLADYLAQLNSVKDLLSWRDSSSAPTYVYKALSDREINDFQKIFGSYDPYQDIVETAETRSDRRNRFLDHLLGRFSERFADFSIFKFSQAGSGISYDILSDEEKINGKIAFLKDYPQLSSDRSHAVNYLEPPSPDNTAVIEKRISRILGIENPQKQLAIPVTDSQGNIVITGQDIYNFCDNRLEPFEKTFGFHIVEHILLRPLETDPKQSLLQMCSNGILPDPLNDCIFYDTYSMRLTVLVPGWLGISGRMDFRKYIEQQFRMEAPAHAGVKICWVGPKQMYLFEQAYSAYLSALRAYKLAVKPAKPFKDKYIKTLGDLIGILSVLKNIYPPSQLDSCDSMEFDASGNLKGSPVILDNSALAGSEDFIFQPCTEGKNVPVQETAANALPAVKINVRKTNKKGNKK